MNVVDDLYELILNMSEKITHLTPSNECYLGYMQRVHQMFSVYMDAGCILDDSITHGDNYAITNLPPLIKKAELILSTTDEKNLDNQFRERLQLDLTETYKPWDIDIESVEELLFFEDDNDSKNEKIVNKLSLQENDIETLAESFERIQQALKVFSQREPARGFEIDYFHRNHEFLLAYVDALKKSEQENTTGNRRELAAIANYVNLVNSSR